MVGQAEGCIDFVEEADCFLDDVFDLAGHHEDVGVVLSEAADTEQAVEGTGQFMTVNEAQFADAQRQFFIGMGFVGIDQHAARAVHRFDSIVFIVDLGEVHVFFVMIPVTGSFPEFAVHDHRGHDLLIAVAAMNFAPVVDEQVADDHALGEEEREARTVFAEHEQAELFAQFTMVALFGFFHHLQIVIEFGFLFKSRPVDTLEHLVLFIAPPVSTGDGLDLKGFDAACRFAVRTGTEVVEVALAIEGDDGIFRKVLDEFYFIVLAGIFEQFQSIGTGQDSLVIGRFSFTILAISAQ